MAAGKRKLNLGQAPGIGSTALLLIVGVALLVLFMGGRGTRGIAMLAIGAAVLGLALKNYRTITSQINGL